MVMCGDASPVVASICDCTDQMSEGGKKHVTYIAIMFEEKVKTCDTEGRNTDVFFFDDSSNVQKAV